MSIAPRHARARRVALAQGRRKLALLSAAAGLAVAGAAVPAVAGSQERPPECLDQPSGAVVIGADGERIECPVESPTTASTAGEPTTTTAAETTPAPAPAEPAASSSAEAPAAAPDAGSPASAPESAGAAGSAGASAPTPAPQDPAEPARPVEGVPSTAATTPTAPAAQAEPAKAKPAKAKPAPARSAAPRRSRARRHNRTVDPATVRPQAPAPAPATADDSGPPASTTVLPAAWTSITPIVLPAFSTEDFPVPAELLPLYQAAGAEYGVPWEILAAINEIETNFGRNASVSSAGAVGFMQFMPSTWERWGRDGDGDRRRDPRNPADAIFSAARYLDGAGAADDLPGAVFAYNHADWYVDRVIHRAREFAGLDADQVAALTDRALDDDRKLYEVAGSPYFGPGVVNPSPGQALLMTSVQLVRRVLNDDRIDLYGCGREDIEAGRIDRRILATLLFLAESGHRPQVSSLDCGHGQMTASGNVSAHSYGAAVDISAVDGIPILGHQGAGSITDKVVHRLLDLQGLTRPAQIITLMTVDGADNTLAMSDHHDHIHVGFSRAVTLEKQP